MAPQHYVFKNKKLGSLIYKSFHTFLRDFVEAPLAALTFKIKCTAEQNVQKRVNIV